MDQQIIETFHIVGIAVRTTNEHEQAMQDIPALWQKFMAEGIAGQITNKISDAIYCVYTDYEKDHTKPYTTILGCSVSSLENVPDGMVGKTIEKANYVKFVAKGDVHKGAVYNAWLNIWQANVQRAFTADFEVYDERALNPADAEVDIFVSVK